TADPCAGEYRAGTARTVRRCGGRLTRIPTAAVNASLSRREERTSEDVGRASIGPAVVDESDERELAGVFSDVAARSRDAAAEDQTPLRVVQQGLSGCLDAESARFFSV